MKRDLQKILGDLKPLKKERKIKVNTGAIEELLALYELELKALSAVRGKNYAQTQAALQEVEKANSAKFSSMQLDAGTILNFISHTPPYFNKYRISPNIFLLEAGQYYAYVIQTGPFITRLINASYKKGNNDFIIPVEHFPVRLYNLCDGLEGRVNDLLCVKIIGDVGRNCGGNSKYTDITLYGEAGIAFGKMAENCIFRCTNKWVLKSMMFSDDGLPTPMEFFPDTNKNCKMYFITKNGEIEIGHT